jgi:hypothetical protein
VLLDSAFAHEQLGRDAGVGPALRHQAHDIGLAWRQTGERLGATAPDEQLRDHFGVEGGAAGGHPSYGVDELGHVGHAVLEQVAESPGVRCDQVCRVALLDVLTEHQHCSLRVLRPDDQRGAETLVGVRGRHADVDDAEVRPLHVDHPEQLVGVVDGSNHLEIEVGE